MSYSNQVEGVFRIEPSVPPGSVAELNSKMRSWRVSPNGDIFYLPSDADEPDALTGLEISLRVLVNAGHVVTGEGRWLGEDGDAGSVRIESGQLILEAQS